MQFHRDAKRISCFSVCPYLLYCLLYCLSVLINLFSFGWCSVLFSVCLQLQSCLVLFLLSPLPILVPSSLPLGLGSVSVRVGVGFGLRLGLDFRIGLGLGLGLVLGSG